MNIIKRQYNVKKFKNTYMINSKLLTCEYYMYVRQIFDKISEMFKNIKRKAFTQALEAFDLQNYYKICIKSGHLILNLLRATK